MLIRSNIFNHGNVLAADYQNLLGSTCNINNAFFGLHNCSEKKSISLLCVKLEINGNEYCKGCRKQNQRHAVNDIVRQFLAT